MSQPTGACVLSIDVTASGKSSAPHTDVALARLEDLCGRLVQADLIVTWGIGSKHAAIGEGLLAQSVGSEVALYADPSWASAGSNRRLFANGLAQAVSSFEAAGFSASTLLLPQGRPAPHDDLLVKHGIRVLRVGRQAAVVTAPRRWGWRARSISRTESVRPVRWGLWEAAVSADLASDGERTVMRLIDRLSRVGGLAVVVANADFLITNERLTSRLIGEVDRRHSNGALRIETFASIASAQQASRSTPIAHSVLRPAAA